MRRPVRTTPTPKARESDVIDEHFVPERGASLLGAIAAGDARAVHHLIRYEWAARCLADAPPGTILDLACGAGYGSHELASRLPATAVLGVDYDAAAVAEARNAYVRPNLAFTIGDALRWEETIGTRVFDVVVCFDMIEHVVHREIMMDALVRHVAPGGALFLSTPCGWNETQFKPDWTYHRIEYSSAALYDFLRRYFEEIVRPEDPAFPRREVFDLLDGGPVSYLLKMNPVICRRPISVENPYREASSART